MNEVHGLFESFSKPQKSEWNAAASSEINGGNPSENLRWKTEDELDFGPFYSQDDINELTYLQQFQLNGSTAEVEPHQWVNMPQVIVKDGKAANLIALTHLQQEAEGIIFRLTPGFTDFETLLNDISWEHCSVSFIGDVTSANQLQRFIQKKGYDTTQIQGAFFSNDLIPFSFESSFRFHGVFIEASTAVNELATALDKGTKLIEGLIKQDSDVNKIFNQVAFSLQIGPQLLVEISKLKALRVLWFQIAKAYGSNQFKASDLHVHGRSEPFIREKFQPHGNLLKSTMAAIAGIGGGVNALTIEPEDAEHPTMNRIARNTSLILRLESHLGKVNDPFAGAYGIEVLVDKIAREAWIKFQSLQ
jgi:methylmalonyl-CoA mutase